ncbi:MAG: asparagine synthase (glutamine-hydrolyzing) [Candidatus Magnetomorum sp.]|nr:asparagine synthase (glutamine-hydrolyzing) [Candidatus Magnetomorum sp.]
MCGIAGIIDTISGHRIDEHILKKMADTLNHRGPDNYGIHVDEKFGFGFKRLSIIDLESGNQPLFNEDRSIVLVCNGEIFNYEALKYQLKLKGHRFYTNTDVEVIVHLYEEYGTDLLHKINGQFAFAIYDKKKEQLFMARDHAGIVPLFYTTVNDFVLFASEIKALLKYPNIKKEVDLVSLDQIFSFPAVISPRTMFKDIYSIKPGHFLIVKNNKIFENEYWDLIYPNESDIEYDKSESECIDILDEQIHQSIKYRLISDVPVGFYLSGGIDSSLIGAIINDLHPDIKRHSFSIGFTEKDIDERKYQKLLSQHINSIHHETVFDWLDISNRLKEMIYFAESPLKETYDTCSLALSHTAKMNNIKVVLTGEGSDEIFAGYIGYRFDKLRQETPYNQHDVEVIMENQIREKLWGDPTFLYERNQFEFRETKQAVYSNELNKKFPEFDCVNKGLINKNRLRGRHPLHKRSYLDFKLRLPDHLLSDHGDRVAYANSVEARYPFLDINLIQFVKTIPPGLLVKNSIEKYILKKYAKKYIPDQIINRQKFAFVAPGSPYLIKQNIEWLNDLLSYETIKKQGYFNPDTIERLKKMYQSDKFVLNQNLENDLLMIVITFGIFLDTFEMPDYL